MKRSCLMFNLYTPVFSVVGTEAAAFGAGPQNITAFEKMEVR